MRVRIDPADRLFSEYIRRRDGRCMRCGRPGTGEHGIVGLQCSHFFGRSKESTRFDAENCDVLCFGCHQYWGSTDREAYREFKLKQLGQRRFNLLAIRAHTYQKKDRKMARLYARELLKGLGSNAAA
jgi:hypothetical protein